MKELSNKELYSVKNLNDNFNDLSIINERIKNLFKETFQVDCEEKKEFIMGNEKIIIKLKEQNYIIEGKLITFDSNYYFRKENSVYYNNNKDSMNTSFNNYIKKDTPHNEERNNNIGIIKDKLYQLNSLSSKNSN